MAIEGGDPAGMPKLSPEARRRMDRKIEKVRDDVQAGRPERSINAPADEYDIREHNADILKGQHREAKSWVWKEGMQRLGFTWYEPAELDRVVGLQQYIPEHLKDLRDRYGRKIRNVNIYQYRKHTVGQYRNDLERAWLPELLKMAFTVEDLVGLYGRPLEFERWFRDKVTEFKAAQAGIVLPGRGG